MRSKDHADAAYIPYTPGTDPASYQLTPPGFASPILTQWRYVTPFALKNAGQFLNPAPPPITSTEFTSAFDEVKAIGAANSTVRTAAQTEIAHFWDEPAFYQWNQIAQAVAIDKGATLRRTPACLPWSTRPRPTPRSPSSTPSTPTITSGR